MGRNRKDLTGKVFGRLTAIRQLYITKTGTIMWECKCECGNITETRCSALQDGRSKSCGCLQKNTASNLNRTHNGSTLSEYSVWTGMKQRCYNKNHKAYYLYGGKGIKMCDQWINDNGFLNFLKDMGMRPTNQHSIDRFPNQNGNYEPSNCRWATRIEQSSNISTNVWYEYKGEKLILAEWCRRFPHIPFSTINNYIRKQGLESAFNKFNITK